MGLSAIGMTRSGRYNLTRSASVQSTARGGGIQIASILQRADSESGLPDKQDIKLVQLQPLPHKVDLSLKLESTAHHNSNG